MTWSDSIQLILAGAAVFAAVVALVVGVLDRRTQLEIARRAREQSRLGLELEYAVRLAVNLNRGGSTDRAESSRLSAEALALATVVGPRWVPRQWHDATNGMSEEELAATLDKDEAETPDWVRYKTETGLAIRAIIDEMYRP